MPLNPRSDREIRRLGGSSRHRVADRLRAGGGALVPALVAVLSVSLPATAQDGDWSVLRAGELRVGVLGDFVSGDERFGADGNGVALGAPFETDNGATLFPEFDVLSEHLLAITGDATAGPVLGPTLVALQTSQVSVPVTVELGVTSWLTLGATVPFHRSRVEGEISIVPSDLANVGVNPAFADYDAVLAYTRELAEAAAGLPDGQALLWGAWAESWVGAYASSSVFPAFGSSGAEALVEAVGQFNAVLAAAGLPEVSTAIPLAEAPLSDADFQELMTSPAGPYQYYPLSIPLLWGIGDVEAEARLRLLQGGPRPETGRPAYGLTALGRVRFPTGSGEDPRGIYDLPRGDGQMDLEAGAAGWVRSKRFGLAASWRYTFARSGTALRRVAPPDLPLVPVANVAEVEWTPGNAVAFEVRPSIALADPLWIEFRYRYRSKGEDSFERVVPLPEVAPPIPFPEGDLRYPGEVLQIGTDLTLHTLAGGLRFQPPDGEFPVEAWVHVALSLAGSGGQTLRESRAEFGGRVYYGLWGN